MSLLTDLFGHELLRQALWVGLLASVITGVLGTFVVVKRLVFLGGGIAHAAFGGLGLCWFLGWPPLAGAAGVAVVSALVLGRRSPPGRGRSHDALIGILWAVGMAVGAIFLFLKDGGYSPDLGSFLFGNLLLVDRLEVFLALAFVAVLAVALVLFWDELVAVTFDEEFAAVQGVPVEAMLTLLLMLTALGVVLLLQLVGILLVLALLTLPPVISLRFARRLPAVMALSTLLGALMIVGGLMISYAWELPTGPTIVLLGTVVLGVAEAWHRLRRRQRREGRDGTARASLETDG